MAKARQESIVSLLEHAREQLTAIEAEYEASLREKSVAPSLRVHVKNYFENIRSVLDYVAHELRESGLVAEGGAKRFYFPILPDAKQFDIRMRDWFPGLKESAPAIYEFLEGVQPYSGAPWLGQFNRINNENKHGDLVQQTRTETERIQVEGPAGGNVNWNPAAVRFGSGVRIQGVPIDPSTQLPVPNRTVTTTRTIWVDFRFDGVEVSALKLMRESLAGVEEISSTVIAALEN